ncbi:MAG: hypothetical protein ABW126_02250 [Candidatus Sedimenticola sp. 4PFRAG1]
MTISNALDAKAGQVGSTGSATDTYVKLVGPASNAKETAKDLDNLSDGFSSGVDLQNHDDDFIGRIIGGNPATYDQRPIDSSKVKEYIRIFDDAPTVHSCYGSGASSKDCIRKYGKAPTMNVQPDPLD